ncbi:restriction endonuclease [Candidatus Poriferisocius sp.]|uniref:restriction endonuclease n=1 Tax=Candidatus Poriferisocius sp. TaxID=3101276 RepID=UPI003B515536
MDLSEALDQFDRTAANLNLLEGLWQQYKLYIPENPAFDLDTPEIDQLRRDYADAANSLPSIEGYRVDPELLALDDYSQMLLDAHEIYELSAFRSVYDFMQEPEKQIGEYKHRFSKARRRLVRRRMEEVVSEVDNLLHSSIETDLGREFSNGEDDWVALREKITEINRLRGSATIRATRLRDLYRHIRFAEPHDLHDIVTQDWPNVRTALIDLVFEGEPRVIQVDDLQDLVESEPGGAVSSKLAWQLLDQETFERLVFEILRNTKSYENVELLMKTKAPDRGRDISATRVFIDEVNGTERRSVVFQCKHWLTKSIGVKEILVLLEELKLWSRTFVEVFVVTSGSFTQDAVDWREEREMNDESPRVYFWPDTHLEHVLATRPAIRSAYF